MIRGKGSLVERAVTGKTLISQGSQDAANLIPTPPSLRLTLCFTAFICHTFRKTGSLCSKNKTKPRDDAKDTAFA